MPPKLPQKPKPMARPPKPASAPPVKPGASSKPKVTKKFKVEQWEASPERILLYGPPKMGKTTLASMAPDPVFIAPDDGSRKILHPVTGERLNAIKNISCFDDLLAALWQPEIFKGYKTVVVDGFHKTEGWATDVVFGTMPKDDGQYVDTLEAYGWGKGYRHVYDVMLRLIPAFDNLVAHGLNIILITHTAQINIPNAGGLDYIKDVPNLQSRKNAHVLNEYCGWVDHIFKVDHEMLSAGKNKKAAASDERCILVVPEAHYEAGSRTIELEDGEKSVPFYSKCDNSIWVKLFNQEPNLVEDEDE